MSKYYLIKNNFYIIKRDSSCIDFSPIQSNDEIAYNNNLLNKNNILSKDLLTKQIVNEIKNCLNNYNEISNNMQAVRLILHSILFYFTGRRTFG